MSERPAASRLARSEPRYEIKFITEPTRLDVILAWVGAHGAGFREPYPERLVNNVYFDGPSLHSFRENLSGTSRRSKLRYRWYGEGFHPSAGTLEIKQRRGGLGWKLAEPSVGLDLEGERWNAIRRALRQSASRAARLWLDAHPLPVLINRYRRRYFVSLDGGVRLTVDWQQRVFDQRIHASPNLRRASNLPDTIVVELKFAPEQRRLANQIVQGLPLRLSRNSKYVIGVSAGARGC